MMESLRAWLLSLAGVALLTALASLFPTSESLRRVTKLAGGVALTCLLFSPLVTFDYDAYAAALQDYHVSVSTDGAVSDSSERLQRTVIESEMRTYILDKAAQCGAALDDAQVTLQWSTDGYWVSQSVRLVTSGPAAKTAAWRRSSRPTSGSRARGRNGQYIMNTRKLSAFAAKYKYVLIILLAGLILLLLPTGSRTKAKTAQAAAVSEQTQPQTIQAEEQRLTTLLQQINGAGQVQVLLSYRCSAERELATDDSGEPTIISAGGGAQEAVELKTVSPQYLGAVVVCDGADSPQVQLAVTQAVAQFTGLSTDHISVLRKQPDPQSK